MTPCPCISNTLFPIYINTTIQHNCKIKAASVCSSIDKPDKLVTSQLQSGWHFTLEAVWKMPVLFSPMIVCDQQAVITSIYYQAIFNGLQMALV